MRPLVALTALLLSGCPPEEEPPPPPTPCSDRVDITGEVDAIGLGSLAGTVEEHAVALTASDMVVTYRDQGELRMTRMVPEGGAGTWPPGKGASMLDGVLLDDSVDWEIWAEPAPSGWLRFPFAEGEVAAHWTELSPETLSFDTNPAEIPLHYEAAGFIPQLVSGAAGELALVPAADGRVGVFDLVKSTAIYDRMLEAVAPVDVFLGRSTRNAIGLATWGGDLQRSPVVDVFDATSLERIDRVVLEPDHGGHGLTGMVHGAISDGFLLLWVRQDDRLLQVWSAVVGDDASVRVQPSVVWERDADDVTATVRLTGASVAPLGAYTVVGFSYVSEVWSEHVSAVAMFDGSGVVHGPVLEVAEREAKVGSTALTPTADGALATWLAASGAALEGVSIGIVCE